MPDSSLLPHAIIGAEGSPEVALVFAYIVRPTDARNPHFLTGFPEAFSISGIPSRYRAANPQAFTPCQVGHGDINLTREFQNHRFNFSVAYDNPLLNPLLLTTPTVPIEIAVLRAASPDPGGRVLVWGTDAAVLQIGYLETFTIQGGLINLTCVPPPLRCGTAVPRLQFNRNCQHALYGAGCNLDKVNFKKTGQIKLSECLPRKRQIVVDGISGALAAAWFTGGLLKHVDTGQQFSIFTSDYAAGKLTATLGHWDDGFRDDDEIELYPGCRKTLGDCETKFANKVNFGGFPYIANRNPAIDSA